MKWAEFIKKKMLKSILIHQGLVCLTSKETAILLISEDLKAPSFSNILKYISQHLFLE